MGVKATTVPIFAAENSPASIRGALVMSWQMYVTFGVFLYVNNLPLPQLYLLRRTNKGDVRKPYCLEDRRYRVATAIRLRIHPRGPFASRHLLLSRSVAFMIRFAVADTLSRVSTMVHEKKRYGAAFASLRRLRNTDLQAARDLFYIHAQLKHELVLQEGNGYFTRLVGLFTAKRNRTATLASFTVMIAQQMCGSVSSPYNLHL